MKMFRVLLLSAAAVTSLGVAAQAADPIEEQPIVDTAPATDMGVYFRGDVGYSMLEWNGGNDDGGFMIGGGVGFRLSDFMRTDLTVDYTGDYDVGVGADLTSTVVMGNAYFDWANDSAFTPYVGVGVGYNWIDNSDNGIALGAAAGVAIDLNSNLALDVGYKFRDTMISGPDLMEHQFNAGLRFSF